MLIPASKLKSVRRQGITILILLLALGSYFAGFVPMQKAFLIQRYFRVLADMGSQVNEAIGNLATSAINATRTPPATGSLRTNNSVFLEAIARGRAGSGAPGSSRPPGNTAPDLNRIQSAVRLIPNLDLLVGPQDNRPAITNTTGPEPAGSMIAVEVKGAGKASWLEFSCSTGDARLRARSDLKRLLAPIVDRGEFDDILLLDARDTNGGVLYQLSSGALQIQRLTLPVDRSFQTNLVNYAGTEYILFSQPLQFVPPGTGHQTVPTSPWLLCGLMQSSRFNQETRSVSYTVLVIFSFLAVLLLASWPFLNVWSVGLKGGLSLREIFLLCVSTVAMNGFLTLLVLDLYARDRLQSTFDLQLERLAASIESNLRSELRLIARQLTELNERFPSYPSNQVSTLNKPHLIDPATAPYPYFGMASWIDRESGQQLAKWSIKADTTPMITVRHREYFRAMAESRPWLLPASDAPDSPMIEYCLEPIFSANTGEYLATFSMRPEAGGVRDWRVIATLDCRLLSLINTVLPAGFGFCLVDPQGKVAFHSDERRSLRENFFEECEQNHRLLAAVAGRQTARLHARYAGHDHALHLRPLAGTPWCLVAFRDKQVSGTTLVEAVSVAVLLLIAYCCLFSATVGAIYASGIRRYMAWLWPTDKRSEVYGLLVVIYLAFALIMAAATLIPSSGLPGCIAALIIPPIAVLTGLRALSRGSLGSPRLRHLAQYRGIRLPYRYGYVLAIGTLLLVVGTLPIVAFFRAAFLVETRLLVKRTQLRLAHDLEHRAQRLWVDIQGGGVASIQEEGPLLIAAARPSASAATAGDSADSSGSFAFRGRAGFLSRRLENPLDVYTNFFFGTRVVWSTNRASGPDIAGSQSVLERWLLPLRPHYNPTDILTRSVAGNGAADSAWTWNDLTIPDNQGVPSPRLALTKANIHLPAHTNVFQLQIDSAIPAFGRIPWIWFLVFIPLLGTPYLVIYILADRVLLLRVAPPSGADRSVLDPDRIDSQTPFGRGKYLLLGPPRSGKSKQLIPDRFTCLNPDAFDRIDLRDPADQQWLAPDKTSELLRRTNRALVIDSFEHLHDDPEFNRKKFQLLNQITLDEPRTVIVVSNIHPLHFALDPAPSGKSTPDSEAATAWVDLIAGFRRLFMPGPWRMTSVNVPEGHTTIDARAMFRSLWRTCSPAEQEVLFDLANGRLISSYQPELAVLLERGLLRRDPSLHLADASFRRFILSAYRPGAVVRGAAADLPGFWDALKGPAITVLIILAAFFFLTQKEMWNNTVGLTTTFLAGIGAFAKASELLQKARLNPPQG